MQLSVSLHGLSAVLVATLLATSVAAQDSTAVTDIQCFKEQPANIRRYDIETIKGLFFTNTTIYDLDPAVHGEPLALITDPIRSRIGTQLIQKTLQMNLRSRDGSARQETDVKFANIALALDMMAKQCCPSGPTCPPINAHVAGSGNGVGMLIELWRSPKPDVCPKE